MTRPNFSKFVIPKTIRPRKMKDDLYMEPNPEKGKWWYCGNCGFPVEEGKAELGGKNEKSGVYHEEATLTSDPMTNNQSLLGGSLHVFVSLELGADGEPKGIEHDFASYVSSGCPFCGCRNWKGKN